jgi:hypothetical protein
MWQEAVVAQWRYCPCIYLKRPNKTAINLDINVPAEIQIEYQLAW